MSGVLSEVRKREHYENQVCDGRKVGLLGESFGKVVIARCLTDVELLQKGDREKNVPFLIACWWSLFWCSPSVFLALATYGVRSSHCGEIEPGLAAFVARGLALAEHNHGVVLLEINTFGDRVDAATEIKDLVSGLRCDHRLCWRRAWSQGRCALGPKIAAPAAV